MYFLPKPYEYVQQIHVNYMYLINKYENLQNDIHLLSYSTTYSQSYPHSIPQLSPNK